MVSSLTSIDQKDLKKKRIIEALKQTGGNRSEAARILGIPRVIVWKQIKEFEIDLKQKVEI